MPLMADCDLTFSTFSAGQSAVALGIRRGWHGRAADQLIDGRRYVGRVASAAATVPSLNTTRGHNSTIIDDCRDDCKTYGSTYARASDGKLKSRTPIAPALDCLCPPACMYACQITFKMSLVQLCPDSQNAGAGLCAINFWNGTLVTLSNWTTNGDLEPCGWSKAFSINCAAVPGGILTTFARVQFSSTNLKIVVNTGFGASNTVFRRLSIPLPAGCHDMEEIFGIYANQDQSCGPPAVNGRRGTVELTAAP